MSDLILTAAEQTTLTNALALEGAGFEAAAKYLRNRIPSLRPVWEAEERAEIQRLAHVTAETMFRAHRGSLKPWEVVEGPTPPSPHPDGERIPYL